METCEFMQLKNCIICFIGHILCDTMKKQPNGGQISTLFQHHCAQQCAPAKEGANKRGNSSRLTQSFHFFMFEPIFSPVNALNQPI
ncbi:hypothetical protein D7Z07_24305 [Escherichia coli]|nr:hypothetical protein [Escherichia coli]